LRVEGTRRQGRSHQNSAGPRTSAHSLALGLAAVPVGGFDPAVVARLLALLPGQAVLHLIPVGEPGVGGAAGPA
jgi:nitroreductase